MIKIMLVQYQTISDPVIVFQEHRDGQVLRCVDENGDNVPLAGVYELAPTGDDNAPSVLSDGCEYMECVLRARSSKQKMLVKFEIDDSPQYVTMHDGSRVLSSYQMPKCDALEYYDLAGNPIQIDNPQIIRILDQNPVLPESLNA